MDAIILAGGRGTRLGVLTQNLQKAVFLYRGKPLIAHVIDCLLENPKVKIINVLTGYRGQDIHEVIFSRYPKQARAGKIKILDFPDIHGTLTRLYSAIPNISRACGYYICGIDSLVPGAVLKRFWAFIDCHRSRSVLLLSTKMAVAPTHRTVCMKNGTVTGYKKRGTYQEFTPDCYREVGIRYFPFETTASIYKEKILPGQYIPEFIQKLIQKEDILSYVFDETWNHFAVAEDFV